MSAAILAVVVSALSPARTLVVVDATTDARTASITPVLARVSGLRVTRLGAVRSCDETDCAARALAEAGADLGAVVSVGDVGDSVVVGLSLLDLSRERPLTRTVESGARGDLAAVAERAARRLFESAHPGTTSARSGSSFAVLDLSASGVDPSIAASLTQLVSAQIKRAPDTSVISRGDLAALLSLEQMRHVLSGACETECMAEIGAALGVDHLVVGSVGTLGERFVVSLRLVDPAAVAVEHRVTECFCGSEEELIRAVRHAVRELLGENAGPGAIAVAASESGATLYLDGARIGDLPQPPIDGLDANAHELRIEKDGFSPWRRDAYVEPGETTAVWAELEQVPSRLYERWWFWTLVGAAAAAGAVAIVAGTRSGDPPTFDAVVTSR